MSGPASLSGNRISLTGVGEVRVKAIQIGNNSYLPAWVEQTFVVNVVLAADELLLPDKVRVFPNPALDWLQVELPASFGKVDVVLIDATGVIVVNDKGHSKGPHKINLSHLPKGLYLLRISHEQVSFTNRILIK